jgi:acetyl esterase/lipase
MISRKLSQSVAIGLAMSVVACQNVDADEPRVHKDIEFANVDGHSLKLDLYQPAKGDSQLVVWIHGGGWRAGSKE